MEVDLYLKIFAVLSPLIEKKTNFWETFWAAKRSVLRTHCSPDERTSEQMRTANRQQEKCTQKEIAAENYWWTATEIKSKKKQKKIEHAPYFLGQRMHSTSGWLNHPPPPFPLLAHICLMDAFPKMNGKCRMNKSAFIIVQVSGGDQLSCSYLGKLTHDCT